MVGASISCAGQGSAGRPSQGKAAASSPPISCRPAAESSVLPPDARKRFCVIDVGSRNVKLTIASTATNDPKSLHEDQQCHARLGLGDKILDGRALPGPLLALDTEGLVRIMAAYVGICERSGGRMVGAIATEWARKATNPDYIQAQVKDRTGLALEILERDGESRYGYLAASRGVLGSIVIDFGSRSLQVSFWPVGEAQPLTVSLPMGIDAAAKQFFSGAAASGYHAANTAFLEAAGTPLVPMLARMQAEIQAGRLKKEIISLGENGDLVMALDGRLWNSKTHSGIDDAAYGSLVGGFAFTRSDTYGTVTGLVRTSDLAALPVAFQKDADLVTMLKSARSKDSYGSKMLVVPAFVSMLAKDLGVETIVLVPQQLATGVIIDKLAVATR